MLQPTPAVSGTARSSPIIRGLGRRQPIPWWLSFLPVSSLWIGTRHEKTLSFVRRTRYWVLGGFGPASAAEPPKVIASPRAASPPVIDGKLDDACWTKATRVPVEYLYRAKHAHHFAAAHGGSTAVGRKLPVPRL